MNDPFNLQRYLDAQDPVFEDVLDELRHGQKISHWMWYIFPQIKGLGHSWTAQHYAINSLEEAKAYLEHPLLGKRLRTCTQLVMNIDGRTVSQIFGYPDNLKFCSSMTLFNRVDETDQIFKKALMRYCEGKPDTRTLDALTDL
jgi:uncharacterized protein (DUF1810 family)